MGMGFAPRGRAVQTPGPLFLSEARPPLHPALSRAGEACPDQLSGTRDMQDHSQSGHRRRILRGGSLAVPLLGAVGALGLLLLGMAGHSLRDALGVLDRSSRS